MRQIRQTVRVPSSPAAQSTSNFEQAAATSCLLCVLRLCCGQCCAAQPQHELTFAPLYSELCPIAGADHCCTYSMWFLEAQSLGSSDERSSAAQHEKHFLIEGAHIVGRNAVPGQSSIGIQEDKSISRQHGMVTVSYTATSSIRVKGVALVRSMPRHLRVDFRAKCDGL